MLENRTRGRRPVKEPLFGVKQHSIVFMDIIPRNSAMVNKETIPGGRWHQNYALHSTSVQPSGLGRQDGEWYMFRKSISRESDRRTY